MSIEIASQTDSVHLRQRVDTWIHWILGNMNQLAKVRLIVANDPLRLNIVVHVSTVESAGIKRLGVVRIMRPRNRRRVALMQLLQLFRHIRAVGVSTRCQELPVKLFKVHNNYQHTRVSLKKFP